MSFGDTIYASGFPGKLMFDVMGWFGDGNTHRTTRYSSVDPAVIASQLTLIKAAGGSGVRFTWQGPSYTFIHQAAMEWANQCAAKQMLFALLINPQVASQPGWERDPGFLEMCNSPAYIPERWLCDFSTGIDYSQVTLPAGFSVLRNQVGFGWINAQNPATGTNATALAQLQATNKQPAMKWPFLSLSFFNGGFPLGAGVRDNNLEVWNKANPYRIIEAEAGNMFHDCLAAAPGAPYVGMAWNDADEALVTVEAFMSAFAGLRLGK
jgi:hypothetical protein